MEKVLITGGAGFVGSHLARKLALKGVSVVILDDFSSGSMRNLDGLTGVRIYQGSVTDQEICRKAVQGVDTVFHLAARIPSRSVNAELLQLASVNTIGTLNLLRVFAEKHEVKRFVLASSASVYGDAPSPQGEDSPYEPKSIYGSSKVASELFVRCSDFEIDWTILRYFNIYGPGQNPGLYGIIPSILTSLLERRKPTIHGDGSQTRDFLHVSDAVEATILAGEFASCRSEIINVGSGVATTINEVFLLVKEVTGKTTVEAENVADQHQDIRESRADILKAKRLLQFEPKIKLREGIQELFKTYAGSPA